MTHYPCRTTLPRSINPVKHDLEDASTLPETTLSISDFFHIHQA